MANLEDFVLFFAPEVHAEIDWSRSYEFLEKELRRISRGLKKRVIIADVLVKVWLKSGTQRWVLLHSELQGKKQIDFEERMFLYNVRSYDLYRHPVFSLAILIDTDPNWKPNQFLLQQWSTELIFRFKYDKLIDYKEILAELEASDNPFALAVYAQLKALETQKDADTRFLWKLHLVRLLLKRGWKRERIESLFEFIDWILALPEDMENRFENNVKELEEDQMAVKEKLSPWARREFQRGQEKGIEESIFNVLQQRFGDFSEGLEIQIGHINDIETLNRLIKLSATVPSLQEFEATLQSYKPTSGAATP